MYRDIPGFRIPDVVNRKASRHFKTGVGRAGVSKPGSESPRLAKTTFPEGQAGVSKPGSESPRLAETIFPADTGTQFQASVALWLSLCQAVTRICLPSH